MPRGIPRRVRGGLGEATVAAPHHQPFHTSRKWPDTNSPCVLQVNKRGRGSFFILHHVAYHIVTSPAKKTTPVPFYWPREEFHAAFAAGLGGQQWQSPSLQTPRTPRKRPDTSLLHGRMSLYVLQKNNIGPVCALKSNTRLTAWGARDCAIIRRFFAGRTLQKSNISPQCRTVATERT